jgi:hypothetical protein
MSNNSVPPEIEEAIKKFEAKKELEVTREKTIYGLHLEPDMCIRVVIGRWVYIGRIVSATYNIVVIEDIFGKRHSISLFRSSAISEIDCKDLDYIKTQVERRQKRKREKLESETK